MNYKREKTNFTCVLHSFQSIKSTQVHSHKNCELSQAQTHHVARDLNIFSDVGGTILELIRASGNSQADFACCLFTFR